MNTKQQRDDEITLGLLEAINQHKTVNQRHLAKQLGIALGLANSYMKRCIRKGLVKINEAPANRYLYYLTPKGFTEKARLTAEYLSSSLNLYRRAGASYRSVLESCLSKRHRKVILAGYSELAEIAALKAIESHVDIVGVYDPNIECQQIIGKKVIKSYSDCRCDAVVLTALRDGQLMLKESVNQFGRERVYLPDILAHLEQ